MMQEHVSTNIRFPRKMLEDLKILAVKKRKSLAQMIREAVEMAYGPKKKRLPQDIKRTRFYKLCGLGASGIRDGAVHHDREIYGKGSKSRTPSP